jgi:hypothetical protein
MATSTLDVRVPQGAIAPKSYGVEITANLQQIPPTSLNNSQVVGITKYSNLTVPVSLQPPWPVQVSDFWSKVGPLLTALSVGSAWIIKEIINTRRKKHILLLKVMAHESNRTLVFVIGEIHSRINLISILNL